MQKTIIAIGGGEIKNKTTLEIDRYVANLAKIHAGEKRANALFIGTASHDSMPYFNSFRKTYTSVFDIKAEVALIVYGEMDMERIAGKIDMADCIYIGGGDTVYMLEKWKETGLEKLIKNAYEKGKIICGLSAGAICWFNEMYTDYQIMRGQSSEYVMKKGLGVLDGTMCPHFNEREVDFIKAMRDNNIKKAYGVENDCAICFVNGKLTESVSSGGKAYTLELVNGEVLKTEI
ncbi:MAG: Type 1 glutamine amidotransferase-like domain-containing protein [Clostridia bacterium]|nr:Type 1 glutamine amidotransferase-like domain-containing protein [Clostridia bacterium]